MEGVVSLLRNLSFGPNQARWNPQVTKMVLQVVKGNPILGVIPMAHRMQLLSNLEPYIMRPCFENTKNEEVVRAKTDMLLLWEYLLEFVRVVKDSENRRKGYSFIIAIMQRDEFSLTRLGFNANSQVPTCSTEHLQLAKRYKNLMIRSFVYVMKEMKHRGKSLDTIHFSAQSLAIFFFTLPLVGGRIVNALEKKRALAYLEQLENERKLENGNIQGSESHQVGSFSSKLESRSSVHENANNSESDADNAETNNLAKEITGDLNSDNKSTDEVTVENSGNKTDDCISNSDTTSAPIGGANENSTASSNLSSPSSSQASTVHTENGTLPTSSTHSSVKPKRDTPEEITKATGKMDIETTSFIVSNPDLFQWNYFASAKESEVVEEYLSTTEEDNICITWLKEKHTFFLTFLEVFVRIVQNLSITATSRSRCGNTLIIHNYPLGDEVAWDVIPAYDLLLECFWPLLRSALWWDGVCRRQFDKGKGWVNSTHSYTRVKITARALLLSNTKLLNLYIKHTYESTNIYALWSVDSCVEHVTFWFRTVEESYESEMKRRDDNRSLGVKQRSGGKLPSNFDFEYYWFGIESMLKSLLFQVLLKVMSLLYNTLDMFSGQNRINLVTNVMSTSFFRLFCHWCPEVRTYFQLLLVYKFLRSDRQNLPCFTDGKVIKQFANSTKRGGPFAKSNSNSAMYNDEKSYERRMAVFDINEQDDEQLLIDIMICSKIDSYVRMLLDRDDAVPEELRVYIKPAMVQYANLLQKYYAGINSKSAENLPTLAHRMIESSTNPYLN